MDDRYIEIELTPAAHPPLLSPELYAIHIQKWLLSLRNPSLLLSQQQRGSLVVAIPSLSNLLALR